MKNFKFVLSAVLAATLSANSYAVTVETGKVTLNERVYGSSPVTYELTIPDGTGPFPMIITQHGSERDGKRFTDGSTDEYSTRLIKKAIEKGFAVVAIDAFYEKNISAGDKNKFPRAENYAHQIRNSLMSDPRFDPKRFYYTGFSYGGRSVLNSLYFLADTKQWRALAAAEPDCNTFIEPQGTKSPPILVMKGGESHYAPKACETLVRLYKESGTTVEYKLFPKSNHYFSHNGKITNGAAFNGCSDNPIVIYGTNNFKQVSFKRVDGTAITMREIGSCFTQRAGSGKSREDLDSAIDTTLDFFVRNSN